MPSLAHANPVVIPEGVAPSLTSKGQGLCVASAASNQPQLDFGFLNLGNYNGGLNSFIEAHQLDRQTSIMGTVFDLSNNNVDNVNKYSYGDFTNSMMGCKEGGCDFFVNDTKTAFASRIRGYLNVTAEMAGKPIHLGLFLDDTASITIFDKNGGTYPIITHPLSIRSNTYRVTNQVTFGKAGLYPIEVLYTQFGDDAVLEMSQFVSDTFVDFERSARDVNADADSLKKAGFVLFTPDQFFLTLSGQYPYHTDPNDPQSPFDTAKCRQCDRQFVNRGGNNGCDSGYYCNDAALCAPCDTALLCGETCSPCGGATPFCVNSKGKMLCGGCRNDLDCKTGFKCDPDTHDCNECNVDQDCERGKICNAHACVPCSSPTSCAGNSCNCCPLGSNGKQMQCAPLDKGGKPVCVECTADSDCAGQRCDTLTGTCVKQIAANSTPDCCGSKCTPCPPESPFCLPTPVGTTCAQCRSDADCTAGNFCLSGVCVVCTSDRRCGPRCTSCGGNKPFCLGDRKADTAACVRCLNDDQCPGGKCNQTSHECEPACTMTCADPTAYCLGNTCVGCYADTQCPCGGTCDPATHVCSPHCNDSTDCLATQHCAWSDDATHKDCSQGPQDDGGCASPWETGVKDAVNGTTGGSSRPTTGTTANALLIKSGAPICSDPTRSCLSRVGGPPQRGEGSAAVLLAVAATLQIVRRRRSSGR